MKHRAAAPGHSLQSTLNESFRGGWLSYSLGRQLGGEVNLTELPEADWPPIILQKRRRGARQSGCSHQLQEETLWSGTQNTGTVLDLAVSLSRPWGPHSLFLSF